MKIEIKHRWSSAVLFSAEISDDTEPQFRVRAALRLAVKGGSDLRGSDLSGSDLSGSDLRDSNLSDSNLSGSDLSGSDLSGSDLSGSDLRGSDLSDSNLSDSNLSDSNLSGSDLRDSNLSDAKNLSYEQLIPIRDDLWAVLSAAPKEVSGLRQALIEGRVNGSTYEGACACLVGTIANVRGAHYESLGLLQPNSSRPIERWFMGISKGDKPDTNVCAKFALQWINEWVSNIESAYKVAA